MQSPWLKLANQGISSVSTNLPPFFSFSGCWGHQLSQPLEINTARKMLWSVPLKTPLIEADRLWQRKMTTECGCVLWGACSSELLSAIVHRVTAVQSQLRPMCYSRTVRLLVLEWVHLARRHPTSMVGVQMCWIMFTPLCLESSRRCNY